MAEPKDSRPVGRDVYQGRQDCKWPAMEQVDGAWRADCNTSELVVLWESEAQRLERQARRTGELTGGYQLNGSNWTVGSSYETVMMLAPTLGGVVEAERAYPSQ